MSQLSTSKATARPSDSLNGGLLYAHLSLGLGEQLAKHCSIEWTSFTVCRVFIGTLYLGKGTVKSRRKGITSTTAGQGDLGYQYRNFQFHPAAWFSYSGFLLQQFISTKHWKFTLTSYNVQHPDSPIFVACENRDFETVRKLLDEGSATPFDITPGGATPLHVSRC